MHFSIVFLIQRYVFVLLTSKNNNDKYLNLRLNLPMEMNVMTEYSNRIFL